jgi:hypothetical protein
MYDAFRRIKHTYNLEGTAALPLSKRNMPRCMLYIRSLCIRLDENITTPE